MNRRDTSGGAVATDKFEWDPLDHLTRVADLPTNTERYKAWYDADGERVKSRYGGVDHVYSYGAGLLHDSAAGGTVYTPGVGHRQAGVDHYYHSDWLGTTRYTTGATGLASLSAQRFDAWGNLSASAGGHGGSLKWAGGVGYEADGPDGLSILGARYYDPVVGRFVSPDPISFAGGLNLYAYCGGDPVNALDPSGLVEGNVDQRGEFTRIDDGGFASDGGVAYRQGKREIFSKVRKGGDAARTAIEYSSPFIPGAGPALAMEKAGKGDYAGAVIQGSGPLLGLIAAKAGGTCASRGFLAWLRGVFGGPATAPSIKTFLAAKAGSGSVRYFTSFHRLKKGLGSPGSGNVWHHIVEQRLSGVFGKEAVHNSLNVAAIPSAANKEIADYYSRKLSFTDGKTLRKWLEGESFEYQHEFGVAVMNRVLQGGKLPR